MAVTVALSTKAFVTKKEIREALFVDSAEVSRSDEELNTLYWMVNDVCEGVEAFLNHCPVIQRSYTQYDDGGGEYVFMTTLPVVSITTVTELGIALTDGAEGYVYDPDLAAIRRVTDDVYKSTSFASGTKSIVTTYVAGYGTQTRDQSGELVSVSDVPDDFKLACYIWVEHLWNKGPANYSPEVGVAVGTRAAIPYSVKEILRNRVLHVHWIGME